jgi:rsbT co-antagonist protein RsbR
VLRTLTGKVTLGAALVLGALILATLAAATSTLTLGSLMRRVTDYTLTQRALSDDFDASAKRAYIEIQALLLGGRWDAQTEAERALTQAATALGELEARGLESTSAELSADYQRLNQDRRVLLKALENLLKDAEEAVVGGPGAIARMRPIMEAFDSVLESANTQAKSVMAREQQLIAEQTENGVRRVLLGLGGSLVALFLVVAAVVVLLRRSIINPLLVLAGAAHDFGKGALHAPIRVTRDDELGVLQQAFATMIDTIARDQNALKEQVTAAEAARAEAEAAQVALSAQLEIVAQQREVIREMSVPVLPVDRTTLVMPLVGALDSSRLGELQQQALDALERSGARRLLLDVTGVPIIDTQVALGLLRTVQAGRLLGAAIVLIGVRPEVAQTLVSLGLELSHVHVARDLQSALQRA